MGGRVLPVLPVPPVLPGPPVLPVPSVLPVATDRDFENYRIFGSLFLREIAILFILYLKRTKSYTHVKGYINNNILHLHSLSLDESQSNV